MIVGEYKHRAVCKPYNVVGKANGPDRVLKTSGAICIVLISKYSGVSHGRDEP